MQTAHQIAEAMFGPVDWINPEAGFCTCPGQSLHTHTTRGRDCRIWLSDVPSLHCFHVSCRDELAKANHGFRSAIAKGIGETCARRESFPARREIPQTDRLKNRAKYSLADILSVYATDPTDLFEQSPCRLLDAPEGDWRLLLRLYQPQDVLWIGDVRDSGPGHERNFRPVAEWLTLANPPGQFTCPSIFRPGTYSRSKENILARPLLVVESDSLTKPEICAVFTWLRRWLRLRAIVDTAGKSLHGWFDFPNDAEIEQELKIILPSLHCDPAMFKASQPCRLPGAKRDDKTQALIYLDI